MSGSTGKERKILAELRGKGAKAAHDAMVLAETAILRSRKDKEFSKDMHIPTVIPEDIREIMTDNELENATVVFGHKALQLFSYVFGQAMNSAIESAMSNLEQSIEKAMERKLTETLNLATNSMSSLLETISGAAVVKKQAEVVDLLAREVAQVMSEEEPAEQNNSASSDKTVSNKVKIPKGVLVKRVEEILKEAYPSQIKASAVREQLEQEGIHPANVFNPLRALEKKGKAERLGEGKYVYKP